MVKTMHLWLFAVGLVVALVLLSFNSFAGGIAAVVWAFIVLPHGAIWLHRHASGSGEYDDRVDVDYWRIDRQQRRVS